MKGQEKNQPQRGSKKRKMRKRDFEQVQKTLIPAQPDP
jgi:hypothetical protein